MKKIILVASCVLMLTISSFAIALDNNLLLNKAEERIYSLNVDYPLEVISNKTKVKTQLGNDIYFETNGSSGEKGFVIKFTEGAYFKNIDALNSIKSLDVTFTGTLQIAFDYDEVDLDVADFNTISSPYHIEFSESVNYFALKALSNASISSLNLTYECQEGPRPVPYLNLLTPDDNETFLKGEEISFLGNV